VTARLALDSIVGAILLPLSIFTTAERAPLVRVEASRMSMGCLYAIEAYGRDATELARTLEDALDEVDRLDRLMSHYKRDSPLSLLNREAAAGPVAVEPELFDLIVESLRYSADADGAFDITVGPLMKAWGFFRGDGRVPPDRELARVRGLVGPRHLILDRQQRTIRFDRPGVEIDLGGIGKGYAVDRVVALLRRRGVSAALVSAGGSTVFALGAPPGHKAWDVDIQDPIEGRAVAFTVPLTDRALSVAGRSDKSFVGGRVRYDHILDPATGMPVRGMLSVIVLAGTGTTGDALDTALFVLGVERGRALLAKYAGTEAHFLVPDPLGGWRVH